MRTLLLADIHSNWPALAAIKESFDACIFLGDVVDYATEPVHCLEWVQQHATWSVRGNHDHSVAQRVDVSPGGTFRQIAAAMRPMHLDVLTDEQLTWLAQLPVTQRLSIDDQTFLLVHATPRDPMDEYIGNGRGGDFGENVEYLRGQWAARLEHVEADFVCVGHTHIPLDLQLDNCRVINPGSVGQPRDGDPRASYVIIDDGVVTFHRVEYDVQRTISHMRQSGVDEEIVKKAAAILKFGGNVPPRTNSQ